MQNISRYLKYLKVSQERDGAPDDPKGQGTQCRTAARPLMRELAAAPALLRNTTYTYACMYVCMYVCTYVRTYVCLPTLPTLPRLSLFNI